jgi:CPA2 family monovalent cation:H+ antiporter-2
MGSSGANYSRVFWNIGKSIIFLTPVVFAAWKIMPRLLARVERTHNDEIAVLLALTTCLVTAAFTEAVGLSLALGAFIAGLLLGSSDFTHKLAAKIIPIRDAFVALFFVTIGMLIDPRTLFTNWRLLAIMVALILAGKFAAWFTVVRLFGYPAPTALRVGIGLTQIGEFSFILAQVSLHAGLIGADVYNATLAASLVTILVNASLFKLMKIAPSVPLREETALITESLMSEDLTSAVQQP